MSYLKVDYSNNFTSICESKKELIEGCGYEYEEISFEDFLIEVEGEYEIIEIKGNIKFLTN